MVKAFGRSSAGTLSASAKSLRPAKTLLRTVDYLMTVILPTPEDVYPFHLLYDFVFDRLRSVRQDLVIQQISGTEKVIMIEKMVMFHAYSGYRLSDVEFRLFDPVINRQHLSECLKVLITLYDDEDAYFLEHGEGDPKGVFSQRTPVEIRSIFEAAFMLHNLLNPQTSMTRKMPENVINNRHVQYAFKIGTAFLTSDYYHILKTMPRLFIFNAFILSQHISTLQVRYLRILNSACSAPQAGVSLKYLAKVICPFEVSSTAERQVLRILNVLECQIDGQFVRFNKSNPRFSLDNEKEVVSLIEKRRWSDLEHRFKHEDLGKLTDMSQIRMCDLGSSSESVG